MTGFGGFMLYDGIEPEFDLGHIIRASSFREISLKQLFSSKRIGGDMCIYPAEDILL